MHPDCCSSATKHDSPAVGLPLGSLPQPAGTPKSPLQAVEEGLAELGDLGNDDGGGGGVGPAGPLVILLVVALRHVELGGGRDLGHDRAGKHLARGEVRHDFVGDAPLLGRMGEDRRAVLRADVVSLLIEGGRVVDGEEDSEQVLVGEDRGVEGDLDYLRVPAPPAAHLLIGRLGRPSAHVSHFDRPHAVQLVEYRLQAPKAASSERRDFPSHALSRVRKCRIQPIRRSRTTELSSWHRPPSRPPRRAPSRACPSRRSRATCCSRSTPRTASRAPGQSAPVSRGRSRQSSPRRAVPTGKQGSWEHRRTASPPPDASIRRQAPHSPPPSSTASSSRSATRSPRSSTAGPVSTRRSPRPPRRCAAAAAWATTSRRSGPRARSCAGRLREPAARCPTCASSTNPARRSNRPGRAAPHRWGCCAATTPTSSASYTPRIPATSPTSTSRWA